MPPRNSNRQVRPERPPPDLSNVVFCENDDGAQQTKYLDFYARSVVPTKYVDTDSLDILGLTESVTWMLNNTGLYDLTTQPTPTFEPLVLEFLSSFSYSTPSDDLFQTGTINFRMFNREYHLDQEEVAALLNFPRGEKCLLQTF